MQCGFRAATLNHMPTELETLASDWQVALSGAAHAIDAADDVYSSEERGRLRHALARERVETALLLDRVARAHGADQEARSKITSTVSCS